jgi:DNA-binding CsgD family transcriptional regulator
MDANKLKMYSWVKDCQFRFTSCSENLVELAGENSPSGMQGKDDFSLIWRDKAEFFREKDIQIIKGELNYVNVVEEIEVVKESIIGKQSILITKIPIFDSHGNRVGIAGTHINLPDAYIGNSGSQLDSKGRLCLPAELGNEYLTRQEVTILKSLLLGSTSKQIAKDLKISFRTVEGHTEKIRRKLQCSHKSEIIRVAIKYGITLVI